MFQAIPSPIAPCPAAAFRTEHERHDQSDKRNERKQRNEGIVSDTPYPIEQERAPVPTVDFRRDGFRLESGAVNRPCWGPGGPGPGLPEPAGFGRLFPPS